MLCIYFVFFMRKQFLLNYGEFLTLDPSKEFFNYYLQNKTKRFFNCEYAYFFSEKLHFYNHF